MARPRGAVWEAEPKAEGLQKLEQRLMQIEKRRARRGDGPDGFGDVSFVTPGGDGAAGKKPKAGKPRRRTPRRAQDPSGGF